MKQRYRLIKRNSRGGTFYAVDATTGKRESLDTDNLRTAQRILNAKNEAFQQPAINLQIAKAYLTASDPAMATRTWQLVMDEIIKTKHGPTEERWVMAAKDTAFDLIRTKPLLETQADHFLRVLGDGTVSTNVYLRRMHNFALDMCWLPAPVLPKRQWPPVHHKEKRAVTQPEYDLITARERNPEWIAFYGLLWHLGGSQTDVATLSADDIDWTDRTIAFSRHKTRTPVIFHFGDAVTEILSTLPKQGWLFPRLSQMHEKHRAKQFQKRLATVNITGISLHSFRYAVAERMKACGYPERFAQQALGHASKAVARAYAKKAQVKLPSLENYETKLFPVEFKKTG
jgi:integrase